MAECTPSPLDFSAVHKIRCVLLAVLGATTLLHLSIVLSYGGLASDRGPLAVTLGCLLLGYLLGSYLYRGGREWFRLLLDLFVGTTYYLGFILWP